MDKYSIARTLGSNGVIVNITAGQTTPASYFDMGGMQLRGILLPANWTACNLSFNVSNVPRTATPFASYVLADTTGTTISIATVASQWIALLPYLFDAVPFMQLNCSVAQTASVIVQLALQPIYQGIHG